MRWVIFLLAFSRAAFSQQLIEGKIIDAETGKPIPFASVSIQGTTKGTSSNLNGEFSMAVSQPVNLKITCVGYQSVDVKGAISNPLIKMKPIAAQLNEVVVFNKAVDPKKIVKKAFASIHQNYIQQPFIQKFFYRHYCKDDSTYGRLIEAFVDVWKNDGYHKMQIKAGDKEAIRVTQIRRSLDKTTFAQGHEPMAVGNILQADIVAYQTPERAEHMSFFSDVSNLKTDIDNYSFAFEGVTTYDGQEVYEISYCYKKDSALTTSGKYLQWTSANGTLFITIDTHAFVKTEDVREFEGNRVHSTAFYRKHNNSYYTYHLIRQGESHLSNNSVHSYHIDLTSIETGTDMKDKFVGHLPGKEELQGIPYDSVFWNANPTLKATPLENKIINDLGEGLSLNKQFLLYREYEMNLSQGGKNGSTKFNWLKEYSKGRRILYLIFWSSDCRSYLSELEYAKQLQKRYRNKVNFVFLSLDDDETQWQKTISKYALYTDGVINYRIGKESDILKNFTVKGIPSFVLISREGECFDESSRHPGNPALEDELNSLLSKTGIK
jgi:hypothetical protein